jgi:hypothetical protein
MGFIVSEFKKTFLDKKLKSLYNSTMKMVEAEPDTWCREGGTKKIRHDKHGVELSLHMFSRWQAYRLVKAIDSGQAYVTEHWDQRNLDEVIDQVNGQLTDPHWPLEVGCLYSYGNYHLNMKPIDSDKWTDLPIGETFMYLGLYDRQAGERAADGGTEETILSDSAVRLTKNIKKADDIYRAYKILHKDQCYILDTTPGELFKLLSKIDNNDEEETEE